MNVKGRMHAGSLLIGLLILFLCVEINRARPGKAAGRMFKKNQRLNKLKLKRSGWLTTKVPFNLPVPAVPIPETTNSFQAAPATEPGTNQWLELESVPPTRISAKLHDEVVLECVAVGSPPPIILWLKNGKPIDSGSASFDSEELMNGLEARVPHKSLNPGFTMAKLRSKLPLRCILPEDEGDYGCMAIQDGGKHLLASATVVIEEDDQSEDWKPECEFRLPPFAYSSSVGKRGTPAYIHAAETVHMEQMGNDIVLPCRSGGKPKPKVVWTGNDGRLVVLGKKFQINTKGDLVIKNLRWSDMGEFNCSVENPYGSETSATFVYPLAEDS